jgi:hypothetical protein
MPKTIRLGVVATFSLWAPHSEAQSVLALLPTWPLDNAGAAFSDSDLSGWKAIAKLCHGAPGKFEDFPSKWPNAPVPADPPFLSNECDDGDQTLFNGLLCAAGIEDGCRAVRDAQAPSGQWFRSPARRMMWMERCFTAPPLTPDSLHDRCANTFSPDMMIGVFLYVIRTGDFESYRRWLNWMESNTETRLCERRNDKTVNMANCIVVSWPRVCTGDLEALRPQDEAIEIFGKVGGSCSLRPQDALDIALMNEATTLTPPTQMSAWEIEQRALLKVALGGLTGGLLNQIPPLLLSSATTPDHFPLHLDAARVLLRMIIQNPTLARPNLPNLPDPVDFVESHLGIGASDGGDAVTINAAAQVIAARNKRNPFYQLLADGPTPEIRTLIVERCPTSADTTDGKNWIWEKDAPGNEKHKSMGWDCLFVANLYNRMLTKNDLAGELLDRMLAFSDVTDSALAKFSQSLQAHEAVLALIRSAAAEAHRALDEANDFVNSGYEKLNQEVESRLKQYRSELANAQQQKANIEKKLIEAEAELSSLPEKIKSEVTKEVCKNEIINAVFSWVCETVKAIEWVENQAKGKLRDGVTELRNNLVDLNNGNIPEAQKKVDEALKEISDLRTRLAKTQKDLGDNLLQTAAEVADAKLAAEIAAMQTTRAQIGKARQLQQRVKGNLAVWRRKPS